MLSFLASQPPRTKQSHLRTITTENGLTRLTFYGGGPTDKTVMQMVVRAGPTIHTPPYHWHRYQTETFFIHKGVFRATLDGQVHDFPAGSTATVEPGVYHTFSNPSDTEELVFSTGLDPMERERDEAFFRNLYGYLDDCRKANVGPSLFQLCLWLHVFDCYLALPGPKSVAMPVSRAMVMFLGVVIGQWLLGYKATYPEYYDGKVPPPPTREQREKMM